MRIKQGYLSILILINNWLLVRTDIKIKSISRDRAIITDSKIKLPPTSQILDKYVN